MRDHFDAVKVMLAPMNRQVHFVEASGSPSYPYMILWGLPGQLSADAIDGGQRVISDLLRVTHVGATPEAVMELRRLSRPLLMQSRPIVTGRTVHELRMLDATDVMIDRDVNMPQTNRHPAYGVDVYRLISEPA